MIDRRPSLDSVPIFLTLRPVESIRRADLFGQEQGGP